MSAFDQSPRGAECPRKRHCAKVQRRQPSAAYTASIVMFTVIDSAPPPRRTPRTGGQAL